MTDETNERREDAEATMREEQPTQTEREQAEATLAELAWVPETMRFAYKSGSFDYSPTEIPNPRHLAEVVGYRSLIEARASYWNKLARAETAENKRMLQRAIDAIGVACGIAMASPSSTGEASTYRRYKAAARKVAEWARWDD